MLSVTARVERLGRVRQARPLPPAFYRSLFGEVLGAARASELLSLAGGDGDKASGHMSEAELEAIIAALETDLSEARR